MVSICGSTAFTDELVHSTTTSGLAARSALAASALTLTPSRRGSPIDVAEVATDLGRIDVDGADDLETRPRRDLPGHGGADRTEAEGHDPDRGHCRNYSPRCRCYHATGDASAPLGSRQHRGPGSRTDSWRRSRATRFSAGAVGRHDQRRRRPAALAAQRQLRDRRPARSGDPHAHRAPSTSSGATSPPIRRPSCSFISTGTPGETRSRRSCESARSSARTAVRTMTSRGSTITSLTYRPDSPAAGHPRRTAAQAPRRAIDLTSAMRFIAPDDGNRRRPDGDGGRAARAGSARARASPST